MNRLLCLLVPLISLLQTGALRGAPAVLGEFAAHYPNNCSRVLADPVRDRIYAIEPSTNSVLVISTADFQLLATIPVGSDPVDMAVSPDHGTLYVANHGSTLAGVAAVDLESLGVRRSFALPGPGVAIAAGLDNRVYVSVSTDSTRYAIYQLDGVTGTLQTSFNANVNDNSRLAIRPDGKRLFSVSGPIFSDTGVSSATLKSFDVSTAVPRALQVNGQASTNVQQFLVSHTGKYLCTPSDDSFGVVGAYETALYSTADIESYYGTINLGYYPGPLSFSPDDSLVYQVKRTSTPAIDVFDTKTFSRVAEANLPGASPDILEAAIDRTGSYLAISTSEEPFGLVRPGLSLFTTGHGTLTPASLVPALVGLSYAYTTIYLGQPFLQQITATNYPTRFSATDLPPGLKINTVTGLISGTPTLAGTYYPQISAGNASGTDSASLELDVAHADFESQPPAILTTALPPAVATHAYRTKIDATQSSASFYATGLPAGLGIDTASGVISGTTGAPGAYSVVLIVENNGENGRATLSLIVADVPAAPPGISSDLTADGALGVAFSYQVTAINSPATFAASGLPAGLEIDAVTGLVSGKPAAVGIFHVALSAANAFGVGKATLVLKIVPAFVPEITGDTMASVTEGQPFSYQITASNTPTQYRATGLPVGLSLNSKTGLISGMASESGDFNVALTAANAGGAGTAALQLTVVSNLPVIDIAATKSYTQLGDVPGVFTVTRTGDLSGKLVVRYSLKGSAKNGVDYVLRTGKLKIKAHRNSAAIKIIVLPEISASKKVKASLLPNTAYRLGTADKARVKITVLPPGVIVP